MKSLSFTCLLAVFELTTFTKGLRCYSWINSDNPLGITECRNSTQAMKCFYATTKSKMHSEVSNFGGCIEAEYCAKKVCNAITPTGCVNNEIDCNGSCCDTSLCNDGITKPPITNNTNSTGCETYTMDLMFLVDGSASIGLTNFKLVKEFLKQVVARIDIEKNQVGVIQYSHFFGRSGSWNVEHVIRTEIGLGQLKSHALFNNSVDRMTYQGYTTFTAAAIRKATEVDFPASARFNDSCSKKIAFVITDGRATDEKFLKSAVKAANDIGVTFFAVGAGAADLQELEIITGDRLDRIWLGADFTDLTQFVESINQSLLSVTHG